MQFSLSQGYAAMDLDIRLVTKFITIWLQLKRVNYIEINYVDF